MPPGKSCLFGNQRNRTMSPWGRGTQGDWPQVALHAGCHLRGAGAGRPPPWAALLPCPTARLPRGCAPGSRLGAELRERSSRERGGSCGEREAGFAG